jgi:hypothetical protein
VLRSDNSRYIIGPYENEDLYNVGGERAHVPSEATRFEKSPRSTAPIEGGQPADDEIANESVGDSCATADELITRGIPRKHAGRGRDAKDVF